MEGTPPGDALPPPPQRAVSARKGARCGAGAGSTRPHGSRPGHAGRGTLAARSGGRAAGGGTAPDTRRPSQRWKAPPPGMPFRHPHSEQRRPAGAHAVGPVLGPHARIDRTRDTRVAEPWLHAPEDERPGKGQRLTPGAPHNGGRHPLPPPPQRATPACKGARCGAGAGSTRPHRPHPGHTGRRTLAARSGGRAARGGTAPDTRRPSQRWKAPPPPGTPFRHPHSEQRRPARAHVVGPVLGPHARIDRTRDTRDAEPWQLPAPEDGRPREGQRLTPGAPHNGGKHPPRGRPFATPTASNAGPQGRTRCGAGAGSSRPHRPHPGHPGRGTLAARSRGQMTGGGTAPDTRRPSQWWTTAPPGTFFRHPHSGQRRPARAHAVGPVLGPHARIDRTRDTRDAEPWLPAPEDGRPGEGQRLTPGAPHNGGRHPPGTPFRHPHDERRQPARAHAVGPVLGPHARTDRTRDTRDAEPWLPAPEDGRLGEGQRLTPGAPHNGGRHPPPGTPFRHPHSEQRRPEWAHAVGPVLGPHARIDRTRDTRVAEPWQPAPEDGRSGKGQRLTPVAPHNGGRHPPRGRPSATPTASNAGPQGRTLWGRCWAHTLASSAPGTHGSRNPGCPLRTTGDRERDSA